MRNNLMAYRRAALAALALLLGSPVLAQDGFDFGDEEGFDFGDEEGFDFGDDLVLFGEGWDWDRCRFHIADVHPFDCDSACNLLEMRL